MKEDFKHRIAEALSQHAQPLKIGLPALGMYRENVIRIVQECEVIIQHMGDAFEISPESLSDHLSIVSNEISKTLSILNDEKKHTANQMRCSGNRKKLEKAYQCSRLR
ncbi:MAG: hypothetical protein WC799_12765 [Desulfobacteraceae bacterium]|jgi:hypothetical protein